MAVFLAMKRRMAKRDTARVMAIAVTTQMILCKIRQLHDHKLVHSTWDRPRASKESVRHHRLATFLLPLSDDAQI